MLEKTVGGYLALEAALAATENVDAAGRETWFRARIQHLRRKGLGLTPRSSPGKVIEYTWAWAARWLIALELEFCCVDPRTAVEFIKRNWPVPRERVSKPAPNDLSALSLSELTERAAAATAPDDHIIIVVRFGLPHELPRIGATGPNGMAAVGYLMGKPGAGYDRVSCFDLTDKLHRLEQELKAIADADREQARSPKRARA